MATRVPPPQNVEAEQHLLGALMDASGNLAETLSIVHVDDFYREGHRPIFEAMLDLFHKGEPIEPLTVIEQLTKSGTLEAAGGREAILDIVQTPYIAATAPSEMPKSVWYTSERFIEPPCRLSRRRGPTGCASGIPWCDPRAG